MPHDLERVYLQLLMSWMGSVFYVETGHVK